MRIRVELDELDLILIDPLPSYVWYQDMVDFADGMRDHAAGECLSRALQGKGAFRRSKNELHQRHPAWSRPGMPSGTPGRGLEPCCSSVVVSTIQTSDPSTVPTT